MITFDQFKALDIRIAKVKTCENHPDADKLYLATVDLDGEEKKVVAGLREHYTPEELIGKQVVVLANLEPATIRGVESQGMILATKDDEKQAVLTTDREMKIGSKVS